MYAGAVLISINFKIIFSRELCSSVHSTLPRNNFNTFPLKQMSVN